MRWVEMADSIVQHAFEFILIVAVFQVTLATSAS